MSASSRGSKALVPLLRRSRICHRCASRSQSIPATRYASTSTPSPTDANAPSPNIMPVTAGAGDTTGPPAEAPSHPPNIAHPPSRHRLRAGVLLSRPPILTRAPSAFESAFYLYQKRLGERTGSPFARTFYLSRATPAGVDFALKFEERRHTMARDTGGRLTRAGRDAWADEAPLAIGAACASPAYVRERLYTEAESRVSEDGEPLSFADRLRIERPLPRATAADRAGGRRALDRALDRTLYLVVLTSAGGQGGVRWRFPTDDVRPDEGLHETAARALAGTAGVNMNTWFVGRHPIAHERLEPRYGAKEGSEAEAEGEGEGEGPQRVLKAVGANVFYLKARIMAGQADLTGNTLGAVDFMWLTKDELKEFLQPALYSRVEQSMPSQ